MVKWAVDSYVCYTYLSQVAPDQRPLSSCATSQEAWLIPSTHVGVPMKTCCHCHIPQDIDNFPHDASRSDGRHPHCRTCRTKIRKPRVQRIYASEKVELATRLAVTRQHKRQDDPAHEKARRQRQHQRYYAKYREKILAKNAAYHAAHPEVKKKSTSKWTKTHPERMQAYCAQRRARISNAPIVESIKLEVLAVRDNWICHLCKKKVTRRTWSHDHLVPLSKGGDHTYINVALAHQRCNSKMGVARIPAQLRLLP
jgi:5-methylcytosine-specific restriction endonuclease McrA